MSRRCEFQIIGHRGVPSDAPENTLAGYRRAAQLGLTHIECDLHLTRDGHLILMHDPTVDRTTDGRGRVSDLILADIKELDCGSWFDPIYEGERVPTLEELLEAVGDEMQLVLEIKETRRHERATDLAVEIVRDRGLMQQTSLTSFYWDPLERTRNLQPEITTQALVQFSRCAPSRAPEKKPARIHYTSVEDLLGDPRTSSVDVICPRAGAVNAQMVETLRERGFSVRVWGAQTNCREEILHVLRSGVDGMTADHPEFVRSVCEEWYGSL